MKVFSFCFYLLLVWFSLLVPYTFAETVVDSWSALVSWKIRDLACTNGPNPNKESYGNQCQAVTAIHIGLLPDGRVLLVGGGPESETAQNISTEFMMTPTPLGQPLPQIVLAAGMKVPLHIPQMRCFPQNSIFGWLVFDVLACGGHALMEDGGMFFAGGTRFAVPTVMRNGTCGTDRKDILSPLYALGLSYAVKLAPKPVSASEDTWSLIPQNMVGQGATKTIEPGVRWYPTVTRLANGKMLVTGGFDYVLPWDIAQPNRSIEVYDPSHTQWTLLSSHEQSPEEIFNRDYTHVFQLPRKITRANYQPESTGNG